MSLEVAGLVVLVAVLLALYLGLARVFYDVRELRRVVLSQGRSEAQNSMRLPASSQALLGGKVLALSSTCSTCWDALRETEGVSGLTVLTYENPAVFREAAPWANVVQDVEAWRVIAHLSPPVLMHVDHQGRVRQLALPTRPGELTAAVTRWTEQGVTK